MKSLVLYASITGNTRRVAETINYILNINGLEPDLKTVQQMGDTDILAYDLVFLGSPSLMWQPPAPLQDYIKARMEFYRQRGDIKLCSPPLPGKNAVVFVTFSGPHTGINEAIPVGKYLGQFLEHLGFTVMDEWYVVGEFHNSLENSTRGRMGDIRGRPSREDLDHIARAVDDLLKKLVK